MALYVGAIVALLGVPGPSRAGVAEQVGVLTYSPDITVALGGTTVAPGDVADDDQVQPPVLVDLGPVPPGANLTGYHRLPDGDHLLAFDVTVSLGGLTVEPRDIVRTDGSSYSFFFSGAALGIPAGVAIDAIAMIGDDLLLSFDADAVLNGVTFDDADVVRVNGATFAPFFDAGAAGVAQGLDLDALHYLDNGHLLVSFDGSGTVGGVTFDDEDVLAYDPTLDTWTLVYDGSAAYPQWAPADLDVFSAAPPAATPTATGSMTATATATGTLTATETPTIQVVETATPTPLPVATGMATATATESPTRVPSATASVTRTRTATAGATATPSTTPTAPTCTGDCNDSGEVTIDEIIRGVNIALGNQSISECPAFDTNGNGAVSIDELVRAVGNALNGCR